MLQVSYQLFGIIFLALLGGIWWGKRKFSRHLSLPVGRTPSDAADAFPSGDKIEHRVLMYLMTQQTESILAALSQTIEQERQKLGVIVRNPSVAATGTTFPEQPSCGEKQGPAPDSRILSLAGQGKDVSSIARRLDLCEEEVAMVVRLKHTAA